MSILPEKPAEPTPAIELLPPPAASAGEALEVFNPRLDNVTRPVDLMYQGANSSVQSLNVAAGEAFRRQFELGLHFWEDLTVARGPADVLSLQARFLSAQAELFAEQSREIQRQFVHVFLAPVARAASRAAGQADARAAK